MLAEAGIWATHAPRPRTPHVGAPARPRWPDRLRKHRARAIAYASARTDCGPEVPHIRLVLVADVDEAIAKAAAARLGFEAWTTDREEVVASPDVDGIFSPRAGSRPTSFPTWWTWEVDVRTPPRDDDEVRRHIDKALGDLSQEAVGYGSACSRAADEAMAGRFRGNDERVNVAARALITQALARRVAAVPE